MARIVCTCGRKYNPKIRRVCPRCKRAPDELEVKYPDKPAQIEPPRCVYYGPDYYRQKSNLKDMAQEKDKE